MKLNINGIEDTSIHYYVPQPDEPKGYLYRVQSVGRFDCLPTYRVERCNYNSFLIIVMRSGSLRYTRMEEHGVVSAGQVLLLDCRYPHSYRAEGRCSFLFFHFTGGQSQEICSAISSETGNVLLLPGTAQICEHIGEMIDCLSRGNRIDTTRSSQLVYAVLMQLLCANPINQEGSTGDPLIDQAVEFIHRHLSEKITVQDIAASIGYNESYFSNKFSRATGCTPYQYLLRSRLERAQLLLQTTSFSINEIAEQTGFNSTANFSYAFRKETGCTPHDFRKRPL